jgi:chromate transporter
MTDSNPQQQHSLSTRLRELAAVFLKLGFTAFGGPAAHVGMMRHEIVERRKWLDDQEFLDLLGAANLIPGPNSTEMAIHVGAKRAGWIGLIVAGLCFIVPAMLIVMVLAWAYVEYGSTPTVSWLLYGVKPVIIAIIAQAIWSLGLKAVKGWLTAVIIVIVLIGFFVGVDTVLLLFGGALIVMVIENVRRMRGESVANALVWAQARRAVPLRIAEIAPLVAEPFSMGVLFLTFLKIGAVLYGGGYTLLAFLQDDFVDGLGWLTQQELIDAVAVGQVTPGPLFTTATFIGYVLSAREAGGAVMPGIVGAVIATLGIFLPSFVFVALTAPIVPRLRGSKWAASFLDGTNAAALGLMAGVTIQLAIAAFIDPLTIVLGVIAAVLLIRFEVNSFWLVVGGAAAGLIASLI